VDKTITERLDGLKWYLDNLNYDSVDEVEPIEVDRRSFTERLNWMRYFVSKNKYYENCFVEIADPLNI
jgi:hypothetical protein